MDEAIQKLQTPKEICLLLLFLVCIISIGIMVRGIFKKQVLYKQLPFIYVLLVTIQILVGYYEILYVETIPWGKNSLMNISAFIFIMIEFLIFLLLLKTSIKAIRIRKMLLPLLIIFPLSSILIWTSTNSLSEALSTISTIESIILIPICLYYFAELLRTPPVLVLANEPSFWIVTGILFLLICITPFYLAMRLLKPTPDIQIVDHLAYIIIVILFTKSFLVANSST
jgi:hypothetical protein